MDNYYQQQEYYNNYDASNEQKQQYSYQSSPYAQNYNYNYSSTPNQGYSYQRYYSNYPTGSNSYYYFNSNQYSFYQQSPQAQCVSSATDHDDSAYQSCSSACPDKQLAESTSSYNSESKKRKAEHYAEADSRENQENVAPAEERLIKRPKIFRLNRSSDVTSWQCSQCPAEFESCAKFLMHEHRVHNDGSAAQCPVCRECHYSIYLKCYSSECIYS